MILWINVTNHGTGRVALRQRAVDKPRVAKLVVQEAGWGAGGVGQPDRRVRRGGLGARARGLIRGK